MKILFPFIVCIFIINGCSKKKELNEDYQAISFISINQKLGNTTVKREAPIIHYILFLYHDTLFQAEIENSKTSFSYFICKQKTKQDFKKELLRFDTITYSQQIELIKNEDKTAYYTCAPEGFYLKKENNNYSFKLFIHKIFDDWIMYSRIWTNKKRLSKKQFPKVYHEIYHSLNSYQLNHHFSEKNILF